MILGMRPFIKLPKLLIEYLSSNLEEYHQALAELVHEAYGITRPSVFHSHTLEQLREVTYGLCYSGGPTV